MFDSAEAPEGWKLNVENFDVFSVYFHYIRDTEPPVNYHRWCLISAIAALLARQVWINHGHFKVYPNLYLTLLGEPASRKSSAIKLVKRLIRKAGYETFAADKTSKEKFLLDLEGFIEPGSELDVQSKTSKQIYDNITADNLWGKDNDKEPKEVFIAADEFSEFTGNGNLEFYTTLGNLWDWDDEEKPFVQRLKNSRSVSIYQPTINILSGTTAELFAKIFPPEAIGSGFLSRLLLIYGERSGRKIPFPKLPDTFLEAQLITYFKTIRSTQKGEFQIDDSAKRILSEIYSDWQEIDDVRFRGYSNRRFIQLLKLCIIIAVARFKDSIDEATVVESNTTLTHAEFLMPKALGEFGKSRNSDVSSQIMLKLEQALFPMTAKELYAYVQRDCEKQAHMIELLQGLTIADKVQVVPRPDGRVGYLPKKKIRKTPKFIDWSYLTTEEKDLAGVLDR